MNVNSSKTAPDNRSGSIRGFAASVGVAVGGGTRITTQIVALAETIQAVMPRLSTAPASRNCPVGSST